MSTAAKASGNSRWAAWLVATAVCVVSAESKADRVPIGGRTATMGGAGVAAGNDSAMPYLNPAGLAGLPGDIFAVSASLYGYGDFRADRFTAPNGLMTALGRTRILEDTTSSSVVVEMPTSVMYFAWLGSPSSLVRPVLGLALVTPEMVRRELIMTFNASLDDVAGTVDRSAVLDERMIEHYFGPTLAAVLGDSFRLGASLQAHYARRSFGYSDEHYMAFYGGMASSRMSSGVDSVATHVGLTGTLGLQANLVAALWVGASLGLPSTHLWGQRVVTGAIDSTVPTADGSASEASSWDAYRVGDYRYLAPLRVAIGAAWDDREAFSAAADLTYTAARDQAVGFEDTVRVVEARTGDVTRGYTYGDRSWRGLEQTLDVSVGVEVSLSRVVSLRGGGFTDFSDHSPLAQDGSDIYQVRLDHVGGTLGVGLRFGSFDTTLGTVYRHGTGQIGAADNLSDASVSANQTIYQSVDAREQALFFVLSGAVTTEEAKKTIKDTVGVEYLPDLPGGPHPGERYEAPPWGPSDATPQVPPSTPQPEEAAPITPPPPGPATTPPPAALPPPAAGAGAP